jgi:MYXO-CTERM domain-containing protein
VGRFGQTPIEHTKSRATIEFFTSDGREIRFHEPMTHEGHVAVLYQPSHPERVQLDDAVSKWGLQAGVILAGLALLGGWRRWS